MSEKIQWIRIRYDNLPYDGILEALGEGICTGIFSGQIFQSSEVVQVGYDVSGFLSLRTYGRHHEITAAEALSILWDLLMLIEQCRKWLWFPEQYVISLDTVWMDKENCLKILWIPDKQNICEVYRIQCFIQELKEVTALEAKEYLSQVQVFLESSYGRPGELKWYFDELLTELHIIHAN